MKKQKTLCVIDAAVHNLQTVSCEIPHGSFCCFTGVSGSGKSSLAFDTIYIEGQRRYLATITHCADRIAGNLPKPDVFAVEGLTPTICIRQKTSSGSPRSSIGTMTEIYDYIRLLFSECAIPYCPVSGEPLTIQTKKQIGEKILKTFYNKKCLLLAPYVHDKKGELKEIFEQIEQKGFEKIRLDGEITRLDEIPQLDPKTNHTVEILVDRLLIDSKNEKRLFASIDIGCTLSSGLLSVFCPETKEEEFFSEKAFSFSSKQSYPPFEPNIFSFNHLSGMCEGCQGLGERKSFNLSHIIRSEDSVSEDCCLIAPSYTTVHAKNVYDNLASIYQFSVKTPWEKLDPSIQKMLLYGSEKRYHRMVFINPNTGSTWHDLVRWKGWIPEALDKYHSAKSQSAKEFFEKYLQIGPCDICQGSRLKPYPAAALYRTFHIQKILQKPIEDLIPIIVTWRNDSIGYEHEILSYIFSRLQFLQQVGLGYLTLDRTTKSLSGGEFQRVRLAAALGVTLSNITYILDEPSIGLHPSDTHRLLFALKQLTKQGNTVIVVEHDELIMQHADYIVDIGPKAGNEGGKIVYQGPFSKFSLCAESITSDYLFLRKQIPYSPLLQKTPENFLTVHDVSHRNVKKVSIHIPINRFTAITGVSGSGKSSLIIETVYPALAKLYHHADLPSGKYSGISGSDQLDKVIHVDQSPIGRTPRSNPATYVGVFADIRKLFASLPESKAKGFSESHFSFNTKIGTCQVCSGLGSTVTKIDSFEENWICCPACEGARFDKETLAIEYKGKSITSVLDMTIAEAVLFFAAIPSITRRLKMLNHIGLGYIRLGQDGTTLSGGEAQRLKIAKELSRPPSEKTIYILDEPSTGLHVYDIELLLRALHSLVEKGHTVLVIEHNMEIVKTADWIIDMGPFAGIHGGEIIATGSPEQIRTLSSPTGIALNETICKTAPKPHPIFIAEKEASQITFQGISTHTLKDISVTLPKGESIALIGPSGAGKKSFAFDTVYAESLRHYVESLSSYARLYVENPPKPSIDYVSGLCPTIAVKKRVHSSSPRSIVATMSQIYEPLRFLYARAGKPFSPKSGYPIVPVSIDILSDHIFANRSTQTVQILAPLSITSPAALEHRIRTLQKDGFQKARINGDIVSLDEKIPPIRSGQKIFFEVIVDRFRLQNIAKDRLNASLRLAASLGQDTIILIEDKKERTIHLQFSVLETGESFPPITPKTFAFNTEEGMCTHCAGWGVLHNNFTESFSSEEDAILCPECNGSRLNRLATHIQLFGKTLPALLEMSIDDAYTFFEEIKTTPETTRNVEEIRHRLLLAKQLGIGYLSLSRKSATLSTGEAERVEFVNKLGSNLSGILYVLDEPTKGLHPDDIRSFLRIIQNITATGNTVLAIEHDLQYIQATSTTLMLQDGTLEFSGPTKTFFSSDYASPFKEPLRVSSTKPSLKNPIIIKNASCHNLKNISCEIPTKALVGIAGVSGSGKSTLLFDVVYNAICNRNTNAFVNGFQFAERCIVFDQKPLGQTHRSDIATFTEVGTLLRQLYAQLPMSKTMGLTPSSFSCYHKSGMCKKCSGRGYQIIDLHFLPEHKEQCSHCNGLRLNEASLMVEFKGMNFGTLLKKSIVDSIPFFENYSKIEKILSSIASIGLGYRSLGEEMISLPCGDVQRLRLALEMAKSRKKTTLYLFDEPTNGLYIREVLSLITMLKTLISEGHSVIVIEHHPHLLAACDYIIELGPKGGPDGGRIIATGTPATVFKSKIT